MPRPGSASVTRKWYRISSSGTAPRTVLHREHHAKRRAPGCARHFDLAAEARDDALRDPQAEARPLARRLRREERLEDLRQHLGRDPGAGVLDGEDRLRLLGVDRDAH